MQPTFDQRFNAGAAVLYELTSVSDQLRLLRRIEWPKEGDPLVDDPDLDSIHVAALESLLVHVRTLTEFLVGRPPRAGKTKRRPPERDIPAAWFATAWTYPKGTHKLDMWLGLIDAHLSHLSLKRVGPDVIDDDNVDGNPPIVWTQFTVRDLAAECERFAAVLAACESDFHAGFNHELQRLQRILGQPGELHVTTN